MSVTGSTKAKADRKPQNGQTRVAGQQLRRLLKSQEEMLGLLRVMQEQQTAIGRVVVHIAEQMAGAEEIEVPDSDRSVRKKRQSRAVGRMTNKPKGRKRKTA